ncbi:flagellin lysine-N-methylase [Paucibacter sp. Y2R2-4]|uniref:flagellin lysine-N-methylase n=1 Tax=Paucibacter sp. Y2R2-4 TaxID=2893553 RepID=UPI0021E43302|nr:flagellin lysine-N-methylase [Paucibacter sp. Y2R2-4]MCV2351839.1 flagellin lysine-N-methylase [Paucibacter sp. Y2R2-4]
MSKFSPQAQAPRYMQSFQCVGSACVETCCAGWQVNIDKTTYQKYQAVKIEPLAGKLRQHVHKASGAARNLGYGVIELKSEEACPFLDQAKLCSIQTALGPEALSRTCSDYPRIYTQDGSHLGLSASLSCPEAARIALTQPDALEMESLTLPFANPGLVPVGRRLAPLAANEADPVRRHASLLREALLTLIRQPGLSAAQAMVVCGMLLRRVAKSVSADEIAIGQQAEQMQDPTSVAEQGMADAMAHYLSPEFLSRAPGQLRALPVLKEVQSALLMGATEQFLSQHGGRASFRLLMSEAGPGFQSPGAGLARFAELDAAQPHLLKNYLLNSLIGDLFPRNGAAELEEEFMAIAVRFALIQFYLKGLAARAEHDFGADDFVRVVYVVARNIEHNRRFMPTVLKALRDQDALRLEVLVTLVG